MSIQPDSMLPVPEIPEEPTPEWLVGPEFSSGAYPTPVERIPMGGQELPLLPDLVEPADPQRAEDLAHPVRRFHVTSGEQEASPPGPDLLPALLYPFKDERKLRTAYPLMLVPEGAASGGAACVTVEDHLVTRLAAVYPSAEDARILRDNLPRFIRHLRTAIDGTSRPVPLAPLFAQATEAVVRELDLAVDNETRLRADAALLGREIPAGAQVLGFGEHATTHILVAIARHRAYTRREACRTEIRTLLPRLQDLLRLEREKSPDARKPEPLSRSAGALASRLLDFSALADVVGPPRGSSAMDPERLGRIEKAIQLLRDWLAAPPAPVVTFLDNGELPEAWLEGATDCAVVKTHTPCKTAGSFFDEKAAELGSLFWALRYARWEVLGQGASEPQVPVLNHLSWEGYTDDELLLVPAVVALESPDILATEGMVALARLLNSGRPVMVLVRVISSGSPGVAAKEDALHFGYRMELGWMGMSQRVAFVEQSSASRPQHLVGSLAAGLDAPRSSLHVVASGLCRRAVLPALGTWLHSGAALESRAHPFFRYDPARGDSWAERFDFAGNPQAQLDWPVYEITCRTTTGESRAVRLAFTFADFGLLEPSFQKHFRVIPDEFPADCLLPVDAWVKLSWREAAHKIPYIWAVDAQNRMVRLAISRALALATRDRLSYWHQLQELAGFNNPYARIAARRTREIVLAEAAAERESLVRAHEAEVTALRQEEATRVLERLAQALLSRDLAVGAVASAPRASRSAPAAQAPTATPATPGAAAPGKAAAAEESFDEPYIDSPLCTTCNECTNLNPLLFKYNGNKQAVIADPRAGTFAQLVQAAEKCPVRIIHPGRPLNPSEPGLAALTERARPFN